MCIYIMIYIYIYMNPPVLIQNPDICTCFLHRLLYYICPVPNRALHRALHTYPAASGWSWLPCGQQPSSLFDCTTGWQYGTPPSAQGVPPKGVNKANKTFSYVSLNSLSVRVPHNISRRVCESQSPDPWSHPVARLPGARFLIKPILFQRFRLPDL